MAKSLLTAATTTLKNHPVAVNGATGATLCAGADIIAQRLERSRSGCEADGRFDRRRFLSAALIGGSFGGFVYPFAYARLDRIWPGSSFVSVLQKSLVEIATVGIFVNSVSMSARGLLVPGRRPDDVVAHVIRELPAITLNDMRVWLPYNLLAFGFIPRFLRPTTTALMEAMWQTYISLRAHDYQVPTREVEGALRIIRRRSTSATAALRRSTSAGAAASSVVRKDV